MLINTIQDYIAYWNNYIDSWYDKPEYFFMSLNNPWKDAKNLAKDALPEPYCGDPFNFSAIILNLNPGGVTPSLQKHPDGEFIMDFKPEKAYFDFARSFPYLSRDGAEATTGGKWWLRRDRWINRLKKSDKNPFAIDICPWHSKSWECTLNSTEKKDYVKEYVIKPAEMILSNADLKVILSVGKDFEDIFRYLQFTKRDSLRPKENDIWPSNKNGHPTRRYYSIWESQTGKIYLNTYSPGSNGCPSHTFNLIELELLRPFLTT